MTPRKASFRDAERAMVRRALEVSPEAHESAWERGRALESRLLETGTVARLRETVARLERRLAVVEETCQM